MTAIEVTPTDLDFGPLHERMQWYVDRGILAQCSTLVLREGAVLDFASFGFMDLESARPLRDDAIYRMYSSTKLVTAIAAMMLFEEGRFGLDDEVGKYLPALADARVLRADAKGPDDVEAAASPITARQVMSHSAGFSYGFIEPQSLIDQLYGKAGLTQAMVAKTVTLEEVVERLGKLPLAYQPGEAWRYSVASDVLARLVEVLSGKRFGAFLRERIFEPLSMHDTGFHVEEAKRERFTAMYSPNMRKPEAGLAKTDDPVRGQYGEPPALESGGGGLVSTNADYLQIVRMLAGGGETGGVRLLKQESVARMRENQLAEGARVAFPFWPMPETVFGLGFAIKRAPAEGEPELAAGEAHWGGMAGSHWWTSRDGSLSGMCMTQLMPGFWHPFSHDFKRLAYQIAAR